MMERHGIFLAALAFASACSFAAGRFQSKGTEGSTHDRVAETAELEGTKEAPAAVFVPNHPPNVAAIPFAETYAILRAASAETLRSYAQELEQLRPKPTRQAALAAFFKTLIHVNPALTKEMILQLKTDDRWAAMFAIRDAASPRGMQAVAEILLNFDRLQISGHSWDLLGESLDEWGKNDPLALKEFLEGHRDQDVEQYFDKLVRNWAAYDPDAAREWMEKEIEKRPFIPTRVTEDGGEEVFDSEWRSTVEQMSVAWIEGFLEHDPDAATAFVLEHSTNARVAAAISTFAGNLFTMSPDRARDFILRLPENQRPESLEGISYKASRFVRSEESDNATSPRFIADWMLQTFPETWQSGISSVLTEWQYGNAQELFNWMSGLPLQTRAAVVQKFPIYVSKEKPDEDFNSIMQVADQTLRDELLEKLMHAAKNARDGMLGVLEKAQLPTEQKIHLTSLIPASDDETATGGE